VYQICYSENAENREILTNTKYSTKNNILKNLLIFRIFMDILIL